MVADVSAGRGTSLVHPRTLTIANLQWAGEEDGCVLQGHSRPPPRRFAMDTERRSTCLACRAGKGAARLRERLRGLPNAYKKLE